MPYCWRRGGAKPTSHANEPPAPFRKAQIKETRNSAGQAADSTFLVSAIVSINTNATVASPDFAADFEHCGDYGLTLCLQRYAVLALLLYSNSELGRLLLECLPLLFLAENRLYLLT